ncbi:hypothetical protein [Burkholderia plantarii]|uniref:hypothetical protein n=1 Tax=Burkholderia plantarii TaxID=41899 RepID=UPI0007064B38|nr:hypothetical protein [Burkholderia plantarii]ALK35187.1 hypothetical protein bpln_1p0410 [Burkholderia plantarii]GLZ22531.1 hypothetical protein Bpla01_60600 [Burkholderia plantarii]
MKLAAMLCAVAAAFAHPCAASPRLPDYAVTEIGAPGAGQYVFCSPATCPEPTIKHLPDPIPQRAPAPVYSSARAAAVAVTTPPAVPHRSKARKRGTKVVRRVRHAHSAAAMPRCAVLPDDKFGPQRFADR